jgi:hypothetical protein
VADGWGPHVSGCGSVAVVSGLARRVGPKCTGGLAVCAGLRCKMEGVLQTSTDVVKAQSGREGFSYFLNT